MNSENCTIQKRLTNAGYKVTEINGIVAVCDPVHSILGGVAIVTGWKLTEVRSAVEAWKFIEDRS